ncbi:X2-like carbohydrate binding domain-containing protein, partial [Paenibacillus sp. cl123]|uniref:X2-like carbohydrate binding domain-containing protein n=1 Tax=Paenibacillus sp. cl123 TaxID=1761875 RepID=UPI00088D64F8
MLKRFLFIFTLVLLVAGISPAYAASFDNWRIGSPLPTGNNLYSSTYGPGKHVAVGDRGTILTSNDGTSWTSPDSGTTQALYGVTYSPGLYVAVGTGGTVLTSTDAESWTNHKVAGNVGFQAVTYGNGVYVAVGGSGAIQTSSNGTSWISRTSNVTGVLRGVAYGAGKFVAVGANGTILTSTDGTSWTKRDSGTTTQLFYGVTYGNGMYIAVGHGGMIVTSTNGETWTSGSTPGITVTFNSVTYGIDTYVAVGRGGTVVTSTNGVNWTKQTSGTEGFNMVSYGNGVYLAVGDLGNVATSNDSSAAIWVNHSSGTSSALYGITYGNDKYVAVGMTGTIMNLVEGNSTWQRVSSNTNQTLYGVTYANGRYVAVGNGGTVVTSSDGVNWTSKTWGSANSFRGVAYGNSTYVAVGTTDKVITSTDGTSWQMNSSYTTGYRGVVYGKNMFVAVGVNGTISTSSDGVSWTSRASGIMANLFSVSYGNGIFVATGTGGAIVTSSDGITWTSPTSNSTALLSGSTYGDDYHLAVGSDGSTVSSMDGVNWTNGTTVPSIALNAVAYGNGMFVTAGNAGIILQHGIPLQNSTINPTTASFDKYASATDYADVVVSMTLKGNSLASIKNGAVTLVSGTDYTVSGSSVTIKKEYLAAQAAGLVNLTFKFSAGADQTLAVTVSDTTPQNSTINPTTANFDKYASATDYVDITVSMTLNGNSLDGIKNDVATLVAGTDYTVSGSSVTIKKEYLATQAVGLVNLTFKFSAGADQTLAVTVSDSTPENSTINPTTANFDKYAAAADYADIAVSMTLNGNSLASIKNGSTTLISGTDYTESGSNVTIKKEYLATQSVGLVNLTFKFSAGADQTLAVTVSDTTPQNSTINPTTANFDKYAAATDYADIAVSMTLNGNSLDSIKSGAATLISGTDYTESGSGVTIKKEYLATQAVGLVNLTFKFSAGADQTLAVTVSDTTPQNSTINPTTASFDKYASATDYADVAVSMSLNGNSLDSIKNGAAALVSGTDYTESGSSVTIKKEYLATQGVGLVNLTFKFSAGADQTLAITVSDSTPQNSTINPTTANFDKYAAATDYADVAVSMTLNGNSLASIKNGAATLVPGTDYTESGSSVTIKKEFLANQDVGLVNLTFKFSAGADQTLAVTVSDTTPQNSTINPTTANFDKYAAATDNADVAVSMTLKGNSLASIKNGSTTLISGTDYTESGSSVTIKKEYLATQAVGLVNLTFKFSAGADQTLAVTVSD